ncbi:VanZ family protein [Natronolimnohabitans innermongolicus]|uniref:VanZ family protein n=1 Tax=Natronolimnohabitans innermongolicus TaxID=253107 RepID=UPI001268053F|nr:VanZ family protein [Natronolimnohabitans innermongolicus]
MAGVICYYSIFAIPPETPAPDGVSLPTWRHVLAYFGLGLSLAYALSDRPLSRRRKMILVVAVATGYGAAIEVGQAFVPERHASLADVVINGLAATLSLAWYALESRARFVELSATDR